MAKRIVVFTGDASYSVRAGIVAIDRAVPGIEWLIVLHEPARRLSTVVRNQWRNLRRNGLRWLPHLGGEVLRRLAARPDAPVRGRAPGGSQSLRALSEQPNVTIARVDDLHDDATVAMVRGFAPDLGLSLASPILREPLFSLPKLGTLNLHKGAVPAYRGMPPAFWELWNDESEVGCTVHAVDARLDTGAIVASTRVARSEYSTVRGLQLELDEAGVVLMRDAASDVIAGTARFARQPEGGRTYRKPTLAQIAALQRKLADARGASSPALKRAVRETAYATASLLDAAVRRFLRPRVTVLLYHRVSDDTRDNLTVGIEQFDRQMALVRRHCEAMSLEAVLALSHVPASPRPLVCVTFDDGYLDNFKNAVPILCRHGVPAAFFVSTAMIGTQRPFPHDVRRGTARPPTMTWDQLRAMRDETFTIGSHSVSHIDCAKEAESVVAGELAQSRDELRDRLGISEVHFAYPFGGREHMTSERLELVKKAGYASCLSAYGGSNVGVIDRYNVVRGGIHWGFTDRAFMFRCLGLR